MCNLNFFFFWLISDKHAHSTLKHTHIDTEAGCCSVGTEGQPGRGDPPKNISGAGRLVAPDWIPLKLADQSGSSLWRFSCAQVILRWKKVDFGQLDVFSWSWSGWAFHPRAVISSSVLNWRSLMDERLNLFKITRTCPVAQNQPFSFFRVFCGRGGGAKTRAENNIGSFRTGRKVRTITVVDYFFHAACFPYSWLDLNISIKFTVGSFPVSQKFVGQKVPSLLSQRQ